MIKGVHLTAVSGLALVLALPLFASAAVFHLSDQVSLPAGEEVNDDVYASGGSVTSAARISGDLYAAGGTVLVSGPVGADLVVAGGTITVTGTVGDDLRAAGGTVIIQGLVRGDALIGGGLVRLDAQVNQDVKIGGGDVYINAPVTGNVEVHADKLTLGPMARIAGTLTYNSPREAVVEEGATVAGETTFTPRADKDGVQGLLVAFVSVATFVFLLTFALGALIFVFFFKRYSHEVVENAFGGPLLELGRGLLVFIVMPVLSVLLLVTIVGIPLGLLGLTLYVALIIFSWLMSPVLIGSLVFKWVSKSTAYEVSWKTVLLGVAVFFFIGFVPIVGGLVQFGFMLLSLGSIARLKWHIAKSWR